MRAAALCAGLAASAPAVAAAQPWELVEGAPTTSPMVADVADWVIGTGDNRGMPFAIVDKASAQVLVFDADGRLKGAASALLGLAYGDHSTPGVGDRELSDIAPEERTTPAGRFVVGYGPAPKGRTVLWVDYATAISLHPVINTNKKEQRPKRLSSQTPEDNRITFGCINVSPAFYRKVVRPTFKGVNGVFYVLPELAPLKVAFPAFEPQPRLAAVGPDPAGAAAAQTPAVR